jgi:hypothetical protein
MSHYINSDEERENEAPVSAITASYRRLVAHNTGPDADFGRAFDIAMEEMVLAHTRGDYASARALQRIARTISRRRQTELVRRAEAHLARRARCCALAPRNGRQMRARRVVRVVAAKSSSSTADPDPEPSSRRTGVRS